VIDYTREDFTSRGPIFDVVVDAAGKTSQAGAKKLLRPNGRYVSVVTSGRAKPRTGNLVRLFELVEKGEFRAVIDRRHPLDQIVEAHRHVDQGHKKGNVVVTVAP
jgi:NADPH:quinone reductase-like Zn-dependent oxidoreductase